jgi:hypothetical protein
MLIDFVFTPTAARPSTWIDLDVMRFRCGIKKVTDSQASINARKTSIFLWSHHPRRHGFHLYQVHYAIMESTADTTFRAKRMNKHERLDPRIGVAFLAEEEKNLESKNIRLWVYLNEIVQEYLYRPMDERCQREIWSAVQDKIYTDVEIVVGDKTFNAHRVILATRSPVFAAMFTADMLESRTGRVVINNVQPDVFQNFLEFLYTGILPNGADQPELFEVADMYQVATLKDLCKAASHSCDPEECAALIVESFI